MELKKKTIIWEDNNEPPKDYIGVKTDGKAYEFDYNNRKGKESTSINVNNNDSDNDKDSEGSLDINTILDNISFKDDLLIKLRAIDYTKQGSEGILTNLTFNDIFNDYNDFIKLFLHKNTPPFIEIIHIPYNNEVIEIRKVPYTSNISFIIRTDVDLYFIAINDTNNNMEILVGQEINESH